MPFLKPNISQFIFIDKYLKFKEIEYFIHHIKFKFFLYKFPLISKVKLNLGHSIIFNSFLDSKLGFVNVGLRLYFRLFPNLQKD